MVLWRELLQADVTILQQINGNPPQIVRRAWRTIAGGEARRRRSHKSASYPRVLRAAIDKRLRFTERGDAMRQSRNFTARRVVMHDIFLRRTNNDWLCLRHGGERAGAIAGSDRLFDFTHCAA
jgi:hypothetical protein